MTQKEKCNIVWREYQPHLANSFSLLQNDKKFQDVTLMSDDFHLISAHRVVLSACSGYFSEVLSQRSHSHPLLCLEGVNNEDLTNVIDYIYHGEIQIDQENLGRFLKIAQKFKLQGLLQNDIVVPQEYDDNRETNQEISDLNQMIHQTKKNNTGNEFVEENLAIENESEEQLITNYLDDSVSNYENIHDVSNYAKIIPNPKIDEQVNDHDNMRKKEKKRIKVAQYVEKETSPNYNVFHVKQEFESKDHDDTILISDVIKSIAELDQKIEENIANTYGTRVCKFCQYQSKHVGHVKEHIEIHFPVSFQCQQCGKIAKTRYALRRHMRSQCSHRNNMRYMRVPL